MKPLLPLFLSLLILASCQNSSEYKSPYLADSVSVSGLTGDAVKLVKTADLNVKVRDVAQSTRDVSALARQLGGMVFRQDVQAAEEGRRTLRTSADSVLVLTAVSPRAAITVRVPAENLERFLYGAADLGYYTPQATLHIDDRSLLYLQNNLKQKARNQVLATGSPATTVAAMQQAVALKDEAIDQLIAARNVDADAAYSTVTLSLFQNPVVYRETVVNSELTEYQLPFGQRLRNALAVGWSFFVEALLALLHLWPFVVLAILGFILYRRYQRQSAVALPAKGV